MDPRDDWHARVQAASRAYADATLRTTDEVLVEVLNALAAAGRPSLRQAAVANVERILRNPQVHVVPQSRETFLIGLSLYTRRPDKGYSLTDCISMQTMREHGVTEVLTHDHHFTQEGFVVLLRG
jgi:uncharacterized protein